MAFPIRRRWLWLGGRLAGLVAATALVSMSVEEPARRYIHHQPMMERDAIEREGVAPPHRVETVIPAGLRTPAPVLVE